MNRKTRKLYKLKPNEASVTEELVQPPLKKELKKNFEFLTDLIQKGKGKTVKYDGYLVSDFITVYFHEKYKQHCPMYPIKTYSHDVSEQELNAYKRVYTDWNKDKFLKNLKLCLETGEQLIMVPISLRIKHLNMLIIKVPTLFFIRRFKC